MSLTLLMFIQSEKGAGQPQKGVIFRPNAFRHCQLRCPETVQADHGLAAAAQSPLDSSESRVDSLGGAVFSTYLLLVTSGETGLTAGAEGATAPETLRQKDRVTSNIWKEALGFSPMRPPTG
ncbi:hypothetical protein ACVWW1_000870 [Bradyrhizobium sp. JR3.5]